MITALEARFSAPVASFRDPVYSGIQKCLPCPSPATIGGMLAAAAGGWDYVDPDTQFAAAFHAAAAGTDVETWHPIDDKGKRKEAQPRDRDFLADVELRLWLWNDMDTWWRRLRRPVWGLRLGRSQDLVGINLSYTTLTQCDEVAIGHAIAPSRDTIGNLRVPTAISIDRTATQWGSYWYFPNSGTMPVGPCYQTPDGEAVVPLPATHPHTMDVSGV